MYKKLFLALFLIALTGFSFADTITNYTVPSSIPLNQEITATGIYADGTGAHPIVWCSFFILDQQNNVIYQATDQQSNTTGRFSMEGWKLNEPRTVRGQTYDMHSECGSATADANFTVAQKQEAFTIAGFSFYPQGGFLDLLYLRDNSLTLFFFFIVIMFFVSLLILYWNNFF